MGIAIFRQPLQYLQGQVRYQQVHGIELNVAPSCRVPSMTALTYVELDVSYSLQQQQQFTTSFHYSLSEIWKVQIIFITYVLKFWLNSIHNISKLNRQVKDANWWTVNRHSTNQFSVIRRVNLNPCWCNWAFLLTNWTTGMKVKSNVHLLTNCPCWQALTDQNLSVWSQCF